ncbi:MAG: HAD hydrolase-like protein [Haliscomenobacter sp.]|nr:HAD hydrolase-like protein [Haliscomenobacter sp.]
MASGQAEGVNINWEEKINDLSPDHLKEGVSVFVKELKNQGLNLAVVSTLPQLRRMLNRMQFRHYFHTLVGGDDISGLEIGLAHYVEAAKDLGSPLENTLVFSASPQGIKAAIDAGCWVAGVGTGPHLFDADLVLPNLERVRFLKILSAIRETDAG